VKLPWQISAGELCELLRPAALVISALLSAWVLASARRWCFRSHSAIAWSLGTFFLPFVVLPLYLIARAKTKRQTRSTDGKNESASDQTSKLPASSVKFSLLFVLLYCGLLFSLIGFYSYRDYNSADAHLARAVQAKLMNQRGKAIREYRAALGLEDNPHTHKLLGIELAEAEQPTEALRELRLAESGGEPDSLLPFRMAQALDAIGRPDEAIGEYRKFVNGQACLANLPDDRCAEARIRLQSPPPR
jgi:tetratricopeptide (TPR) repeat protein